MKRQINIDYIGVVRRVGDGFVYEECEIVANERLIEQLRTMVEDESKTILDVQACLVDNFGDGEKMVHNYVLPHIYKMSFVDKVCYPEFMVAEHYENERAKIAESVEYEEDVATILTKYDREKKKEFLDKALRYIAAVDFAATAEQIQHDPTVIISSHEEIGWSKWEYSLNDDIKIILNTNLGMGYTSYMTVDVSYKGIVLPSFSHFVKYFEADACILSSHTASYTPERENWVRILHFVVSICQAYKDKGEKFYDEWAKDSLLTLKEGMSAICVHPEIIMAQMCNKPADVMGLFGVGGMSQADHDKYERYPAEMLMLFKATKTTQALDFVTILNRSKVVKSLINFNSTCCLATSVADYIEQLNRELVPTLLEEIAVQHSKTERLNGRLDPLTEQWRNIEDRLDENPEDAEMLISKGRLDEKIDTLLNEIVAREGFMKTLQQCYAKITKSGVLN